MRTPAKSNEAKPREFQFPDYTSSSEYEEIYHAYQDLLAKCAKYEAALKEIANCGDPDSCVTIKSAEEALE